MVAKYNEDNIQSLSPLQHIRLRPGMYIGRLGNGSHMDDGIYILLKEVIDNSIDEFVMGCGTRINITILNNEVTVRDFGRGIPLGKVVDCVSMINTGAKYDNEAFTYSVGLNGVGTKAVNALSESFTVTSYRDGEYVTASFCRGEMVGRQKKGKTTEPNGTLVSFIPDSECFPDYSFHEDFILSRLWNYAYLNTGLTIEYNKKIIKSQHGLIDLLDKEVGSDGLYDMCSYKGPKLEFAFTHTNNYGETYFSYVNGQHTSDGGTHLSAFKEGILKGVNEYFKKNWSSADVRDGIIGAISVKVMDPIFESQTKNKLGNTEIRTWIVNEVKENIIDVLMKNTNTIASAMGNKIANNERIHKEETTLRQGAREQAKKVALNIPKLRDCKYHLNNCPQSHRKDGENSVIFLTEGDSASGTITTARDAATQAVFSLRGKPFNVFGCTKKAIYEHEELYNIMAALGIENDLENLRYGKVIIATDADTDGYHIRILLMTFFLTYFEELITSGRLFILETPLFRVRNKQQTVYCYSEKERDYCAQQIKGAEITRFKGLGEISAKEFKQFIGEDIKLLPVTISSISEVRKKMEFFMGKNTPVRRDFIMEHLV